MTGNSGKQITKIIITRNRFEMSDISPTATAMNISRENKHEYHCDAYRAVA